MLVVIYGIKIFGNSLLTFESNSKNKQVSNYSQYKDEDKTSLKDTTELNF